MMIKLNDRIFKTFSKLNTTTPLRSPQVFLPDSIVRTQIITVAGSVLPVSCLSQSCVGRHRMIMTSRVGLNAGPWSADNDSHLYSVRLRLWSRGHTELSTCRAPLNSLAEALLGSCTPRLETSHR